MRRCASILILLSLLLPTIAQDFKPCGTAVLARRHASLARRSAVATRAAGLRSAPVFEGTRRGLIILVSFPDQPFSSADPKALWSSIANMEGYAENGAAGSVSDYFRDQSYGQFQLQFDVIGPVETKHGYAYYGENIDWGDGYMFDGNVGELVDEACHAVADSVNFADYDWDGDGEVEQVFLLYAGHGENDYEEVDPSVIWPHMAMLSLDWEGYEHGLTIQDVRIDTYACSNEINYNGLLAGMGTICHEFSHCLGLPDLYNTETSSSVLGHYDLMDQGCYNGGGWCPAGYSSYERYACGWLTPEATDTPLEHDDLTPLNEAPEACIYHTPPEASDYYLIERRKKTGWDAYLPSAGLMAWHIDYDEQAWQENIVNNDAMHLRVEWVRLGEIPLGIARLTAADASPLQSWRVDAHIYVVRYSDGTTKKVFR